MKNTIKNIIIGVLALMVVGGFVLAGGGDYNNYSSFFNRSSGALILVNDADTLGNTGNRIAEIWGTLLDISGEVQFDNVIIGGDVTTLTFGNSSSTAAEFCDSSILRHANNATTTFGLPTAATMIADCLQSVGKCHKVRYQNMSTTSDNSFTIGVTDASLATTILTEPSGGDVIIKANEWADIEICNLTGATTTADVVSRQDAD